jgi:transposase
VEILIQMNSVMLKWLPLTSNNSRWNGVFAFLKTHYFFASSLFLKNPKRIMALLMVMFLSLLVYGIAERRMRACLAEQKETLPNQIGLDVEVPTLRWVFQLLYGINYLDISLGTSSN